MEKRRAGGNVLESVRVISLWLVAEHDVAGSEVDGLEVESVCIICIKSVYYAWNDMVYGCEMTNVPYFNLENDGLEESVFWRYGIYDEGLPVREIYRWRKGQQ